MSIIHMELFEALIDAGADVDKAKAAASNPASIENRLTKLDHDYMMAQIANLMAQTAKVNKDLKWYEVGVVVAATLAVVAPVKGVL